MQADEDIGKIAMAVPLLVCKLFFHADFMFFWNIIFFHTVLLIACVKLITVFSCFRVFAAKALELFLQDLCDKTYNVTLRRGAKTMNAFHL